MLWFFLVIDLLILLIALYETFLVSSNSSLGTLAFLMVICIGASWFLRNSHNTWALVIAGIPACIALVFVLFWFIMMLNNKGNWQ